LKRARIQNGSVVYNKRFGTWNFLWLEDGRRKSRKLGDLADLPTKPSALKRADAVRMELRFRPPASVPRIKALVEQYRAEKMPSRYSTRRGYEVWLRNHILPRWGEEPITALQPRPAEIWLSSLDLSPKSRGHVRGLLHVIWDYAMWSGSVSVQANPISLVTVRGSSKRTRQPRSLTVDEFQKFLCGLEDPFRTIALVCVCFGLRISECLALKWADVDWLSGKLSIERGIVKQRVDDLKTIYSGRKMSIDNGMLAVLRAWKQTTQFSADENWVFASPVKHGRQPWSYDQVWRSFLNAGVVAGIGKLGTHSMRHTYRSWLDAAGTAIAVQQKLMRHGDIRTTMNVYGDVVTNEMQQAHSKVVQMALPKPN
jgi:integrase